MKGQDFDKFLYTYLIFIFFIFFVVGLGGPEIFGEDFHDYLAQANTSREVMFSSTGEIDYNTTESQGIMGWLGITAALNNLNDAIGLTEWMNTNLDPLHNFVSNIWFFFQMAYAESTTAWLTTLVFVPAGIFLFYGLVIKRLGK